MILTGHEIIKQVRAGAITIHPFCESQVNPNSYNYRLGKTLLEIVLDHDCIDPRCEPRVIEHMIGNEGFVLQPGKLYLGNTVETIGSTSFASSLIGRSTIGRLGMWLQVTADLGHVGTHQSWTLEIKVVQPLRVYAGMEIGQVCFYQVEGKPYFYRGPYHRDRTVRASLMYRELAHVSL